MGALAEHYHVHRKRDDARDVNKERTTDREKDGRKR